MVDRLLPSGLSPCVCAPSRHWDQCGFKMQMPMKAATQVSSGLFSHWAHHFLGGLAFLALGDPASLLSAWTIHHCSTVTIESLATVFKR